ncbi:MAG: glycosyltransferase family 4 protein [Patescibacteria group bacterium]|jgi:phosphatidylinositol alpha-1,6-mannosyltransferase
MKTLLITLEYPPHRGGVANYYGNLSKHWPLEGKIEVLDNSRQELLTKSRFSWLKTVFTLRRRLQRAKIDFVLVGQILPLGTAAYLLSLFQPFRYGVFLHGLDFSLATQSAWKRFLTRQILKRADKILACNRYVKQQVSEFLPTSATKLRVFNPGITTSAPLVSSQELAKLDEKYQLADKLVLFSLGRLVKRKGVDQVIAALNYLPREKLNQLVYFVAGHGPEEQYLKKLVPLELARKIIFLGAISESEKWTWLKRCDILVMPARELVGDYEGFGIVYLEANLVAKPVIAGDSGGVRDAVVPEETGLLVDPEKVEDLAAAIIRLAEDKDLRERLGRAGQKRAITEFNWEKQARDLYKFIKN